MPHQIKPTRQNLHDELARSDVHERVKYFCGVTNEELLEKLK